MTHDPFQEGVDARAKGKTLADNPYCIRTDDHIEWAAGWRATLDLDEDIDPASDRDHASGSPEPSSKILGVF
jgi:hypothetical protein